MKRNGLKRKITRAEVAQKAGTSKTVVTWVMNGIAKEKRIPDVTIERVRKAAEELNYRPDIWGKVLRTRRSGILGLISTDVADPNSALTAKYLGEEARARGYSLMLFSLDGVQDISDKLNIIQADMCEGFLIHLQSISQYRRFVECGGATVPFCIVGLDLNGEGVASVEVDNVKGAETAVKHLVETGCKRIGVIADLEDFRYTEERLAGCKHALKSPGSVKARIYHRSSGEDQFEAGVSAVKEWNSVGDLPDGIFAMGDVIALGALSELDGMGIRCPDRIKMVGFDGTPFAQYSVPPLTTIAQPFKEMATEAVGAVISMIEGGSPDSCRRLIPPRLVRRESTAT